jgi:Ca-activated chloride channel family protein
MKTAPELESMLGQLILTGNPTSALPLQKTTISGRIFGVVASLEITQQFNNPFAQPLELTYLFPLSHTAAITGFNLQIGSRLVRGDIQELENARQQYSEAVEAGRRAGLLEQRRPNLFAVRLGNILPGETILAVMQIQDKIRFEDGVFEVVLPMGLTQRYHTGDHPEEEMSADSTYAAPGEKIGTLEISLNIEPGSVVELPTSPTHPLRVSRLGPQHFQVSLEKESIPNKDFILRYAMLGAVPQACSWLSHDSSGDFFLATLFPPALAEDYTAPQREFIFVLDRSGSMSGEPITQARNALRACLRTLNPGDRFRILLFDDQVEWEHQNASDITQQAIDQADSFLSQVEGRGGTEILAALQAVFSLAEDRNRQRYIVLLTDGAVSAEERVLQQVRQRIGRSHLFTFGIGPSVNRALLSQMAHQGRGTAEFLQLDEDIEGAIIRFQDRVGFPILTDLSLTWEGAKGWDLYPARLPDLYAGQPVELCGRVLAQANAARLIVRGRRNNQVIELVLPLPAHPNRDQALERMWARARVDDLLEKGATEDLKPDRVRTEIISLALQHSLVTPYTAFVAVDIEQANLETSPRRIIQVAQPLPEGLSEAGFNPMLPPSVSAPFPQAMPPMKIQTHTTFESSGSGPTSINATNSFESTDMPVFLRRRSGGSKKEMQAPQPSPVIKRLMGKEETLRWLARSQSVDGSWQSSLEWTAAALLAFVRAGHTTRTGSFRQTVRRAATWIEQQTGLAGLDSFLRALALDELASATNQPEHLATAAQARQSLNKAATSLEQAVAARLEGLPGNAANSYEKLATMDELRLAGILKISRPVAEELLTGHPDGFVDTWAALQ